MTYIKNFFVYFWDWLLLSSADPEKYSLTVKGVFATLATLALLASGIFHYTLDPNAITGLGSLVSVAISDTLTAVSYVATAIAGWSLVWGAVRKLIITLVGAHPVLND